MAEDIYFNKNRKNAPPPKKPSAPPEKSYTERIEPEQLSKKPGQLSFNNIKTEDGYIKAPDLTRERTQNTRKKQSKKPKNKALRVIKGLFISLFALSLVAAITLIAGATGLFSYVTGEYKSRELQSNEYVDEASLIYSSSCYNILLMGTDTLNTEDTSRSDAMILLSIDQKNGKIKLTSFLRDSYVEIPGYGKMKLNASCVYGGPQLVCDTIEYNFGIRIDDYMKIGYDMFIKIIDAVGGVTVPEIDETEASALAKEGFITEPGENVQLDGYNALLYCRIRRGQDDFYRTERQREVISAVLNKAITANPVTLLSTAKEIMGTVECSINKASFITLLIKILPCLINDIEQFTVPAEGSWYNDTIDYQAVLVLDFEENKEKLTSFLYE